MAIKKPGALHRDLGVPEDDKIPVSKIKAAAKGDGKVAKRARLALTLRGMNKEEAELDELSKKTLGSYVKKASDDKVDAGMALQRSTTKPGGQTRGDVDKHAGKMIKRRLGIDKAVDKLSKEAIERDRPGHSRLRPKVLKPSLKGMSKKAKAIIRFKANQAKKIQNKDNRAPGEDLIK